MPNILDYLTWRGDLSLEQNPICAVDGLILSALSYLHFDRLIPDGEKEAPTIEETAQMFFELTKEEQRGRIRNPEDLELLEALGKSARFGRLRLTAFEGQLDEQREIQFAAVTVILGNGNAFAAFRGTDSTLVGWKEDFNMAFLDTIPAQLAARDYLERIAGRFPGALWAAGHSKGGNLAVFAAAKAAPDIRKRIQAVYNNDGPGFRPAVLQDEGYREILPRIHTFVPQSSVVGMLLEHEEPYTVVQSRQLGLFQHEPYSWEVLGPDFVRMEHVTEGSRVLDQTVKDWLFGLTPFQRGEFVDAIYELLKSADAEHLGELIQPKNVYAIFQHFGKEDEKTRHMILKILSLLGKSAAKILRENAGSGKEPQ